MGEGGLTVSATSDGGSYTLGGRFECCDCVLCRALGHTGCHDIPWARTIAPKPDRVPQRNETGHEASEGFHMEGVDSR
eukprot:7258031-Prymnesium_polylepis.1